MSVGENIRRYRKSRGMTQAQLAEAVGLTEGAVRHYYKNEKTRNEIDFVVDGNRRMPTVIPIEVKSGMNLQAKSLTAYVKKYSPELALRCSLRSHAVDGAIEDVPLYALGAYFRANIAGLS